MATKYKAFISYSHQDKKWGDWLHKSLESYKIPRSLIGKANRDGKVPDKLFPIFRDREELPTATDLGAVISDALEQSAYLIVICSPRSAKSMWVNQEILNFKRLGKENRVLAIIVDGEPNATEKPDIDEEECFPEALRFNLGEDGELSDIPSEPIAADARDGKDGKKNALLKLTAGLLGVNFDELKQREKRRRKQRQMFAAFATGLLLIAGYFYYQYTEKLENERLVAQSKSLAIRSQQALQAGDSKKAIQLALQALPKDLSNPSRPFVVEAEMALSRAVYRHKELFSFMAHKGKVTNTVFSPDGKFLVTGGEDWKIRIWDSKTQSLLNELNEHKSALLRMVFHPSMNIMISWDVEGQLVIWDTKTWKVISKVYEYGSKYKKRIYFSGNGQYLIVNELLWDLQRRQRVKLDYLDKEDAGDFSMLYPVGKDADIVAFNGKGLLRINLLSKNYIKAKDLSVKDNSDSLKDILELNNGRLLLIFEKQVSIVNRNLKQVSTPDIKIGKILGYRKDIGEILYFYDDNFYVWRTDNKTVRKLDIKKLYTTEDNLFQLKGNPSMVVYKDNAEIKIIDLLTGSVIETYQVGKKSEEGAYRFNQESIVQDISFNADGSHLNVALLDGRVKVFDTAALNGRSRYQLPSPIKQVRRTANNRYLAGHLENNDLVLIDVEKHTHRIIQPAGDVDDFIFARHGKLLAVLSDRKLKVYDTATANQISNSAPFDGLLPLKPNLALSRSQDKIAVYTLSGQQAVYNFANKSWMNTEPHVNIHSVFNLKDKWGIKGGNVVVTKIKNETKTAEQSTILNTTLDYISTSTARLSADMNKAVWLKDDYYEYVDLKNGKIIYRYLKGKFDSTAYLDITQSGEQALFGNTKEIILLKSRNKGIDLRIKPLLAESAGFSGAFFNSDNSIFITEKRKKGNSVSSVVYLFDTSTNKPVWMSAEMPGEPGFARKTARSVSFTGKNYIFIVKSDTGELQKVKIKDSSEVLKLSPNNRQYIAYRDGRLSLWDIDSGEPLWSTQAASNEQIYFSLDGKYISIARNSTYGDGYIDVLNTKTGKKLASNQKHRGKVYGFDKDSNLISWQSMTAICKWDWKNRSTLYDGHNLNNSNECIPQTDNNATVFIGNSDLLVLNNKTRYSFYSSDSLVEKAVFECEQSDSLLPLSAESESVSCLSLKNGLQVFDASTSSVIYPFVGIKNITQLKASKNGRYFAAVDRDGSVFVRDIHSKKAKKILTDKTINQIQVDDSGRFVAVVKKGGESEIWDVQATKKLYTAKLPIERFWQGFSMYLHEDKFLVLVAAYGDIVLWQPATTKPVMTYKIDGYNPYMKASISLKYKRFIFSDNNKINVWDLTSGKLLSRTRLNSDYSLKYFYLLERTGHFITQYLNKADVFDLASGKKLLSVELLSDSIPVFSPAGNYMAVKSHTDSGGVATVVTIWGLRSLKKVSTFSDSGSDNFIIFDADEKQIATITPQGLIRWWSLSAQQAKQTDLKTFYKLDDDWLVNISDVWPVNSINIQSPDTSKPVTIIAPPRFSDSVGMSNKVKVKLATGGEKLVYIESKNSVALFNLDRLESERIFKGINGKVMDFDISVDEKQILTVSDRGVVQGWDMYSTAGLFLLSKKDNTQHTAMSAGIVIKDKVELVTFVDKTITLWDSKHQGVLGEFNASANILSVSIKGKQLAVIDENSMLSFLPLLPRGQKLIDRAWSLVH